MPTREFCVLLVENNDDHAELALRAIQQATTVTDVCWVRDGEEALDFLLRRRRYADPALAPRPGLILLDLKLPKLDGHEVLTHIKAEPTLAGIPVVMLTTSTRDEEAAASLALGAASFIRKPMRYTDLVARLRELPCLAHHLVENAAMAAFAPRD